MNTEIETTICVIFNSSAAIGKSTIMTTRDQLEPTRKILSKTAGGKFDVISIDDVSPQLLLAIVKTGLEEAIRFSFTGYTYNHKDYVAAVKALEELAGETA